MMHNFDYKTIWDAFTRAASPVVAEAAFDSIRTSLNDGHTVKISLGGQDSIEFSTIQDFNQWVQDTFYVLARTSKCNHIPPGPAKRSIIFNPVLDKFK